MPWKRMLLKVGISTLLGDAMGDLVGNALADVLSDVFADTASEVASTLTEETVNHAIDHVSKPSSSTSTSTTTSTSSSLIESQSTTTPIIHYDDGSSSVDVVQPDGTGVRLYTYSNKEETEVLRACFGGIYLTVGNEDKSEQVHRWALSGNDANALHTFHLKENTTTVLQIAVMNHGETLKISVKGKAVTKWEKTNEKDNQVITILLSSVDSDVFLAFYDQLSEVFFQSQIRFKFHTETPPDWMSVDPEHDARTVIEGFDLSEIPKDFVPYSIEMHRGFNCDGCGMHPIRVGRWRCLNCPDYNYDLCFSCIEEEVGKEHIKKGHKLVQMKPGQMVGAPSCPRRHKLDSTNREFICDRCGQHLTNEHFFCKKCDFDLCCDCINLTFPMQDV